MTAGQGIFYGKVMLFGEYSVIEGSDALLLPYRKVNAILRIPEKSYVTEASLKSNHLMKIFAAYLSDLPDLPVNMNKLTDDLTRGLFLESTIPPDMGLGSSGAVCAAIYDKYGQVNPSLAELKNILAGMESFFHGKSSGADPLCIYKNAPVLIHEQAPYLQHEENLYQAGKLQAFLVKGGTKSRTDILVRHFRERMGHEKYRTDFRNKYILPVNDVIRSWISHKARMQDILRLSELQLHFFEAMIPPDVRSLWNAGLSSEIYAIKICGSGGGGMMLGFTPDKTKALEMIGNKWSIEWLD